MQEIFGFELEDLHRLIGPPGYRAQQVFEWLYARNVFDFRKMTNLPAPVREEMAANFTITMPEIREAQVSADGTTRYLMIAGGDPIESVHMPDEKRDTICISSQSGCSFGCRFCVTARMSLRRHLSAGEIVAQVLLLLLRHGRDRRVNVVFMGMGEPLHNYDNVMAAFRLLTHPKGAAISPRRITISTVGYVPSLIRLKDEPVIPYLAVSLNAPNDEIRGSIMPINRTFPIARVLQALSNLPFRHRQRITFEYVMLKGVNDRPEHAEELLHITRGLHCKVNLIPLNPDPHVPFERPDDQTISRFARVLADGGRTVAVRRSRGPDISAACGQLGSKLVGTLRE